MIQRLNNQQGITLIETIATVLIMAVALISIYIGILYADKQMQRNYHDRVAILAASGELEWQFYYKNTFKVFDEFSSRTVVLDNLARGRTLNGTMSIRVSGATENIMSYSVNSSPVEITVRWIEPGDNSARGIVVREDFY